MVEVLVTCSMAVYLVALLYGAYRILMSRQTRRAAVHEHYRTFILLSQRAQTAPDVRHYV